MSVVTKWCYVVMYYKSIAPILQGFYTVYRNVFEKISDEDSVFLDSKVSECELPNFGDSLSKFDEVSLTKVLLYNAKEPLSILER